MAYDEIPKKPIEIRQDNKLSSICHDDEIESAGNTGEYGFRTDVLAEGVGYLAVDDLDRIRRKNLKHRTR